MIVADEGYSNLLTMSVADEGYSNLLTMSVADEASQKIRITFISYTQSKD
jgi:hypothetical protein